MKHLDQYAGAYAMDEAKFRSMLDIVQQMDLKQHQAEFLAAQKAREQMGTYQITLDGYAVVNLIGAMTKYGSSLSDTMPFGTIGVRKAVRAAAKDSQVKAIVLMIDSPGGTVAGTGDLAADVAAAAKQKPVVAYIEDTGASAAYWVASQATRIVANPSAIVGSIGTYMVVDDVSGMYEQLGVKTHVVRAGEMKGAGTAGEEITDERLADMQRLINEINSVFTSSVKKGRRMTAEQLAQVTDGRAYVASVAQSLGLVDVIGDYTVALKVAGQLKNSRAIGATAQTQEKEVMNDITSVSAMEPTRPKDPASYADLKACLPGVDAEFICAQMERNATLDQAQSAWMEEQNKRIAAANAKAAEAAAKAESAAVATGVAPLAGGANAESASDPIAEVEELTAKKMALGKPKHIAYREVMRSRADLREALVAAARK